MIDEFFSPLGAHGYAHIRDLDSGRAFGVDADEPVILVSVVKIFIAWEFSRQVAEGLLDPAAPVLITAADRLGGTGTAGFRYDARIALGDLAALMMEVSDNTAADLVAKHIGIGTLRGLPSRLGLRHTRLAGPPRTILEDMARDLDIADLDGLAHVLASGSVAPERLRRTSPWDPWRTNASTPADMTEFLRLMWASPSEVLDPVRHWMGRQLFGRFARLAPDDVIVYGRTGSLPGWINEVAVWERPDGRRYAIAMFVRTAGNRRREVEQAMGHAALRLVTRLETGQ